MILIQILFIILILFILSRLLIRLKSHQVSILNFLIWLIFWIGAGVIVLYPEATNFLARLLGVGRGADVIIYFSLILLFYFIFYLTVRLRVIERQITEIVRKISLEKEEKRRN